MDEKRLFSTREAAAYVGLSVQGLKRNVKAGHVRCTVISRVAIYERDDLDAFKLARAERKAGAEERKRMRLVESAARFKEKRAAEREAYLAKRRAEEAEYLQEQRAEREAHTAQLRAEVEAEMRRVITRPQK